MTSSLYNSIVSTGIIVPDTSTILSTVQQEYLQIFGQDMSLDPSTPQGVLITAEALAETAVVQNNAELANQINPNVAGGVFLDALLALTGMQRTAQTQTQVTGVTVTGVAGTVIPAGSQASTAAGDLFYTLTQVTLPSGGSTTVNFASVAYGAIPCATNALANVVSSVLGWETVDNTAAGVLGSTTQSDQAARALRQNTLAFNGISLAAAITSALYNVPGVTSLTFQENTAATTQTINGISMVGHSVYACVEGGTDTAVAAALLENKSSGAAWNGDTTVDVVEPASGQTYAISFDRPTGIAVLIRVYTSNGNVENITQAILDYANGLLPGFAGFVVGASVSAFDIAGAINSVYPNYYLSNVQVSLESSVDYGNTPIPIGVNQIATTQASYITVNIT